MTDETIHDGGKAVRRLLEYLEDQRTRRCEEILARADAEAEELRRGARHRALELVREAVRRERSRRAARLREEEARIDARFRRERFRRERNGLKRARKRIAAVLVRRWQGDADARREWVRLTCEYAVDYLPDGEWRVTHPPDWDPEEARPLMKLLQRVRSNVKVAFDPGEQDSGLLVFCGSASVDSRPGGLMADRRRLDGLLLRAMEKAGDAERDT